MDWKEVDRLLRGYTPNRASREKLEDRLRAVDQEIAALQDDYAWNGHAAPAYQPPDVPAGKHGVTAGDPTYRAMVSGQATLDRLDELRDESTRLNREINEVSAKIRASERMFDALNPENQSLVRLLCFEVPNPSFPELAGRWARLHPDDPREACVSENTLRYRYKRLCEALTAML